MAMFAIVFSTAQTYLFSEGVRRLVNDYSNKNGVYPMYNHCTNDANSVVLVGFGGCTDGLASTALDYRSWVKDLSNFALSMN